MYAEDNVIAVPRCIVLNDIPTLASMPQPFMCCSFYVRSVNRSIVRVLTSCLRNVDNFVCVCSRDVGKTVLPDIPVLSDISDNGQRSLPAPRPSLRFIRPLDSSHPHRNQDIMDVCIEARASCEAL